MGQAVHEQSSEEGILQNPPAHTFSTYADTCAKLKWWTSW